MKLPRFIKIPQYSRFEYKPLYYDERKERLEAKIKEYQKEKEPKEGEKRDFKPDFKGNFTNKFSRDITARQKKAANLRVTIVVIFLVVITYLILDKADVLSYMFEVLLSK